MHALLNLCQACFGILVSFRIELLHQNLVHDSWVDSSFGLLHDLPACTRKLIEQCSGMTARSQTIDKR